MPPVVKERSGSNVILPRQGRFWDKHSWLLGLWIGSGRQERFTVRQMHCDRVDAGQLEVGSATRLKTHPTLVVDSRGGFLAGQARCITYILEPCFEVNLKTQNSFHVIFRTFDCWRRQSFY